MKFNTLNRNDSIFYKGVAILLIVIHNFMHLFPSPKEMEFQFYNDRFEIFILSLGQPLDLIRVFFSYFGHFGVQVFVFLSAYGLTKRYANEIIYFSQYMLKRIKVIYPSFLLAIVMFSFVTSSWDYGVFTPFKEMYWSIYLYLSKILMISNFIPGQEFSLVGPWWFLSFIFQFYLIFPILFKLFDKWGVNGLLVISIASILINMTTNGKIGDLNLYFTVLGHLPEFCLGIYFAKKDHQSMSIPNWIPLFATVVFIIGNINNIFWHVTHISFLILLIFTFSYLNKKINHDSHLYSFFLFFGSISMPLFLVNGFLREPFLSLAKGYDHWLITISLCLSSLLTSILFALILSKLEKYLLLTLNTIKNKFTNKNLTH